MKKIMKRIVLILLLSFFLIGYINLNQKLSRERMKNQGLDKVLEVRLLELDHLEAELNNIKIMHADEVSLKEQQLLSYERLLMRLTDSLDEISLKNNKKAYVITSELRAGNLNFPIPKNGQVIIPPGSF